MENKINLLEVKERIGTTENIVKRNGYLHLRSFLNHEVVAMLNRTEEGLYEKMKRRIDADKQAEDELITRGLLAIFNLAREYARNGRIHPIYDSEGISIVCAKQFLSSCGLSASHIKPDAKQILKEAEFIVIGKES